MTTGGWRTDMENAPKNEPLLLFGKTADDQRMVQFTSPVVFTGYWSHFDEAWCAHGSHWDGPFFEVTYWMPLPAPPPAEGDA